MTDFLFILFSVLTVLAALLVMVSPNPINAAMFMIVSFVGTACLFLLLDAFFLAVLQVLVYAGAVMVLFLFIVMLLDVEEQSRKRADVLTLAASGLSLMLMVGGVIVLFGHGLTGGEVLEAAPKVAHLQAEFHLMDYATAARAYGYGLFTKYILPFQVTGFLLLIAMIGVIVISKKLSTPRKEGQAEQAQS